MNLGTLLSIIVPVYNVEAYLEKCVKSILAQTYGNIEVILVDNGSTDRSGEICEHFAREDARVIVCHKKHGNISTARNKGLELARGQWIGFVDADDWIEADMYQCLLEKAWKEQAQIVVCGFCKEQDTATLEMKNKKQIATKGFDGEKALEYAFIRDSYRAFCAYVWNKVFCAELLKDQRFDENIQSCEDVEYFARVTAESKTICYVDKALYHYTVRRDSSWKVYRYEKRMTVLKAYEKIIALLEDKKYKKATMYVKRFYAYHASLLMEFVIQNQEMDKYDEVKAHMKKFCKEYYRTNMWKLSYISRFKKLMNYNA